jgi:hypothetical protein
MVLDPKPCLCFLVYKYRYDRLYNIMQLLEVFGLISKVLYHWWLLKQHACLK